MYPGDVKNHIHDKAGRNQPMPKMNPTVNRWRVLSARISWDVKNAMPIKARGHQPHGGIDAATSTPAMKVLTRRRLTTIPDGHNRQRRRCQVRPVPRLADSWGLAKTGMGRSDDTPSLVSQMGEELDDALGAVLTLCHASGNTNPAHACTGDENARRTLG